MNKKIIAGLVAVVLVGGSFYGGIVYGKGSTPTRDQFGNGQFMGNPAGMGGMRTGMSGGLTAGEIISKDATSITIKMQDGSTKIVLIGASTQVMRTATGTIDDLIAGITVSVAGTANSDGSVTAQSVQMRPAGMFMGTTTPR